MVVEVLVFDVTKVRHGFRGYKELANHTIVYGRSSHTGKYGGFVTPHSNVLFFISGSINA